MATRKPHVRKMDGRWIATKPPYGFSREPVTKEFRSHKSAVRWALGPGAATSAQVENAQAPDPDTTAEGWFPIAR